MKETKNDNIFFHKNLPLQLQFLRTFLN